MPKIGFHVKTLSTIILYIVIILLSKCNCKPPASTCYSECKRTLFLKVINNSNVSFNFFFEDDNYDDEFDEVKQTITKGTFVLNSKQSLIDTITYSWTGVDGCHIFKSYSDNVFYGTGHATKMVWQAVVDTIKFKRYIFPYDTLSSSFNSCDATLFTCGDEKCETTYSDSVVIY